MCLIIPSQNKVLEVKMKELQQLCEKEREEMNHMLDEEIKAKTELAAKLEEKVIII